MKSLNFIFLCSLALAGLTISMVTSAGASSSEPGSAITHPVPDCQRSFSLPEFSLVVCDGQLPNHVSELTPLSLVQSIAKRQRFANEPAPETASITIMRLKRMLSIDELGLDSERAVDVSVYKALARCEGKLVCLQQASLLALNVRLQV